ncbi:kinase [Caulobacter sp. RL271]|jgi:D-glycerate 3-kinase|uniref:Kinase n=1 Tax=Caulobacter segnis TaxID=88688 RepID=A0ABY4ZQ58_9CAUL|nr:kinase [Caulobacter segnis]USQ94922.1 kinase [Caulobacter segnis]
MALTANGESALVSAFVRDERLPPDFADLTARLHRPLARRIAAWAEAREAAPLVVGICGPQGCGKSTLTGLLALLLEARDLKVATLSIDDLYLPRTERERLARAVHPLLRTRGVPGTHDPALGVATLDALARAGPTALPRFDKAADDRAPAADWPIFEGPADIVLLEGWCVGARPQPPEALAAAVNSLERDEDPDGTWRGFANAALAGPYRALFGRLDRLALLTAPDFAVVRAWRGEQEDRLRQRLADLGRPPDQTMDGPALDRFVAHYERLTRWIAQDLPGAADVVIRLDAARRPLETLALANAGR